MKVILIKDCKDGKKNEIIDISDGYAKNFLIKNGYAQSVNNKNLSSRNKNINYLKEKENLRIINANILKKKINSLKLSFKLKSTKNIIHGSITRKQIIKELRKNNINIEAHNIEHIQIKTFGMSSVLIKIYKDIETKLKVEVVNG